MQDEIIKHTKKIWNSMATGTHTPMQKFREIIIEIFIIVFAVTLSIGLHSWNEHRHEQHEAKKFLIELKEDLNRDIELLKENRQTAAKLDTNFKFVLQLKNNRLSDTALGPYTDLYTFSVNFNTGRYEGFKSGGKIGTIENDSLKNNILVYYQQTIPNLISEANFLNNEQIKILNAGQNEIGALSLNTFLTSKKMHSMYYFLEYNFRSAEIQYKNTIAQAHHIIEEINNEFEK